MRKRTPLAERFWAKVVRDPETECWEWTGTMNGSGYGRFFLKSHGPGQCTPAHRFAYELLVGPIAEGLVIDHLCRNPGCVNPGHLEPVPQWLNCARGTGWSGRKAAQTHCKHGHPFDDANTKWITPPRRRPWRRCRTCEAQWALTRIRR